MADAKQEEMQRGHDESPRLTLDTIRELAELEVKTLPTAWYSIDAEGHWSKVMAERGYQADSEWHVCLLEEAFRDPKEVRATAKFIALIRNHAKELLHYAAIGYASESGSVSHAGLRVCRKCGGQMKPGQALQNVATAGAPDLGGEVVTMSYGKEAKLVDCMKCENCGWSVTSEQKGGRE